MQLFFGEGDEGMYLVPMGMPECCNRCPFGHCDYSFPCGGSSVSRVDGRENNAGTYGYVCNVDFQKNGRYTEILRAEYGKDIKKPEWCGLEEAKDANPAN